MSARAWTPCAALIAFAIALAPLPAAAAGTYAFCARWSYQFNDQNLGEDHLRHSSNGTGPTGSIAAASTWGVIERNGAQVWSGYMDANGCTGAVTANAGTYVFFVTAAISRNGRGAFIYPTDAENWRWFSASYSLNAMSSGTFVYGPPAFGVGDTTASVAAIMTRVIAQSSIEHGMPPGTYKFRSEQACPSGAGACHDPQTDAVFIGPGRAFVKNVVAHEFGHYVQSRMIGTLPFYSYDFNSAAKICACTHIPAPNNSHCLQSREHIGAAFMEGFGHFYSADLFNNAADGTAIFPYYKEIWLADNWILPAGWPISLPSPTKWMETNCNSNGRGTEFDWMEFLYALHTVSSNQFTLANFDSMWNEACDGTCVWTADVNDTIWWSQLSQAVDSYWGASSAKAGYFRDTADIYGVNW
jgi:hypothetical protein